MKREAKRIAEGFEADERVAQKKAEHLPKSFAALLETVTKEAAAGSLTLAKSEEYIRRLHKLANPNYSEVSLREFWSEWIKEQTPHISESTKNGYEQDLALFECALGDKIMRAPIRSLTTDQINSSLTKARKPEKRANSPKRAVPRRAATVNKALAALRRVLESAVARNLVTHNAAKQCRSLNTEDSTNRAPFTIQEIRAMVEHSETSDEWRGAIIIAAHTGLRLSDILSLNVKNITGTRLVIMPSKTAKSKKVITVPLTPACIQWISGRSGDFFPALKKQSTPLCSTQFARIMSKAGVPRQIELPGGLNASRSFHALRHTFASMLAEADVHADIRQRLTGHSSSKIHQRYTHHDEALDRAVSTLPKL